MTKKRSQPAAAPRAARVVAKAGEELPPLEILAEQIEAIGKATRAMMRGALKEKTIWLLISHSSGVSQRDVRAVLDHMQSLEAIYLKPKGK